MLKNNRQSIDIFFAGHALQLLASGGCYWPIKKTLIVSDLHLEKGSYFAVRGQPLPTSDTRCTLERLQKDLLELQPDRVICLGDNVHDAKGFERMGKPDLLLLETLSSSVSYWQWVIGNHDKINFEELPLEKMQFFSEVVMDNLYFTHEPQKNDRIQIMGHYHPKISIKKQGVMITGKCFSVADDRLIMPAYGSYTGGLDIKAPIYRSILKGVIRYYLIFKENIFFVDSQCKS